MIDKFEAMALFVQTVESGSMSAAARKLAVPVTTVSRKIAELEAHLGVRLLIRSTRRLEPTEAGASFLAASRRLLEDMSAAEREAAGEYASPRGELMLTAPLSFGRRHVLPVVNAFLARYPDITVRLCLTDQYVDLIGQHVDLAVRMGVLRDGQLVARGIGDMRWVVVASPELLAEHGVPQTPEDLAGRPCVGIDFVNLATWWRFRLPGAKADHSVPVQSRLAVSTGEAAVDAAVAGIGFTQTLLYQAAAAIAAGRLRVVLEAFEPSPLPNAIVYTGRGRMPLKTRSFLDFAAPRLRDRIGRLDPHRGFIEPGNLPGSAEEILWERPGGDPG